MELTPDKWGQNFHLPKYHNENFAIDVLCKNYSFFRLFLSTNRPLITPGMTVQIRVLPKTEKNANTCFSTDICYNVMIMNHFT
jgi:hypothetical protein